MELLASAVQLRTSLVRLRLRFGHLLVGEVPFVVGTLVRGSELHLLLLELRQPIGDLLGLGALVIRALGASGNDGGEHGRHAHDDRDHDATPEGAGSAAH